MPVHYTGRVTGNPSPRASVAIEPIQNHVCKLLVVDVHHQHVAIALDANIWQIDVLRCPANSRDPIDCLHTPRHARRPVVHIRAEEVAEHGQQRDTCEYILQVCFRHLAASRFDRDNRLHEVWTCDGGTDPVLAGLRMYYDYGRTEDRKSVV